MGWQKYTVGGFMAERSYRDNQTSNLALASGPPASGRGGGSFLFTLDSDEPVCNSARYDCRRSGTSIP
jgi:hypothetical protein